MDETKLIEQIKAGDKSSYTRFYKLYKNQLYSLALKMTGNPNDAEDIVQEAFMQAFKNINGFGGKSKIYTWLFTITKNICLRFLEKKQKASFTSQEELIFNVQDSNAAKNYSLVEKQDYVEQIKEGCLTGLIRCLSFNQRMVFVLHVLLELPVKEVAEVMGKSETAIRILVHRSRHNILNFLCKNCSLYNKDNPCRCENLIDFSLKQGWIYKSDSFPEKQTDRLSTKIGDEINGIKKVVLLYQELSAKDLPVELDKKITSYINSQNFLIFSEKKVK